MRQVTLSALSEVFLRVMVWVWKSRWDLGEMEVSLAEEKPSLAEGWAKALDEALLSPEAAGLNLK